MRMAAIEPDDAALFDAWRAGDRGAGERLFERHFEAIYRFFEGKVSGDVVGDLVQRTFLGCVEARERFRGTSSFRTFLYAIARHELFALFRRKKAGGDVDFGVSSLADLAPTPSTLARQRSQREHLVHALCSLPLELQLALELRFFEELSGPDLALVLEVPEGTVRSRLRRGLEALREALSREEASRGLLGPSPRDELELERWAEGLARRARER